MEILHAHGRQIAFCRNTTRFGWNARVFQRYENPNGLLQNVDEKWNLVDWPKNLRDDYDYDFAIKGVNTVLNGFYYGSLLYSSKIYDALGVFHNAVECRAKAKRLRDNYLELLFDTKTGLFLDAQGSSHSAFHANVLPLTFQMVDPDRVPRIVQFLKEKRIACGVYFANFLLYALYDIGQSDFAFDLLTCHDERSWYNMIASGATSCMEAWGPDQKWNTSWMHPWASCPISIVAEEIMGLKPGTPGWNELDFSPQTPAKLDSASLSITTQKGIIAVHFKRVSATALTYNLKLPDGLSGLRAFPKEKCACQY